MNTLSVSGKLKVSKDAAVVPQYLTHSGFMMRFFLLLLASLVAQTIKHLPAMWETHARSLGWEDPLEKKGYPLQSSGLENSMDCIVHGVAKSETRLSALHTSLWSDVQFALELERGESSRARGCRRCYQGRLSRALFSILFSLSVLLRYN